MIDKATFYIRTDEDRWNAGTGAPFLVDDGRRNVIPEAAVLVIGDDDEGVLAVGAVEDVIDQFDGMVLAIGNIGIAGVFVVDTEGFYKRDTGQGAGLCSAMNSFSSFRWSALPWVPSA
jgi:hypothetical protein